MSIVHIGECEACRRTRREPEEFRFCSECVASGRRDEYLANVKSFHEWLDAAPPHTSPSWRVTS